jgi:hypothetical protein
MNALTEKATRNALSRLFDPPLSESQVASVIYRMDKMLGDGQPEDYAFVTAIERYKSRYKKHALN